MFTTLDDLIDLLDMKQLDVTQVNQLLEDCLVVIANTDPQNVTLLTGKRNVIENRMRIIDETLQRNQIALLGFERLRAQVEKFYATR